MSGAGGGVEKIEIGLADVYDRRQYGLEDKLICSLK